MVSPSEIISKRIKNSKTFDLGGGKHRLVLSDTIHYKDNYADKSEQWKDIDLTWEGNRITKAPYELTLEGNKITVRDKETGEISTLELLEIGGKAIPAQAWEKSRGLARAFDTNLEVVAENTRVRFTRILKSDKASREAKYKVTGNIPLRVSAGDEEDELPVEWTLKDGILTETLKPDRPVKYPVRVDPTLTIQPSSKDAFIQEANADRHRGASTTLQVNITAANEVRSLCEFAITWGTDIANGATLDAATFSMYVGWTSAEGRTYKAQRLLRLDWIEGADEDPSTSGATWNDYKIVDTVHSTWTTAGAGNDGADYTSADEASDTVPAATNWMDWNVLTQVQWAQTNDKDIAFRIVDEGADAAEYTNFDSNNGATANQKPKLAIDYTPPPETYEVSATDGVVFSDAPTFTITIPVSVTEGLVVSDTPTITLTIPVSATEGLVGSDAPAITLTIPVSTTEGLVASDAPVITLTIPLSATEGIVLSDTVIERLRGFLRNIKTFTGRDISTHANLRDIGTHDGRDIESR